MLMFYKEKYGQHIATIFLHFHNVPLYAHAEHPCLPNNNFMMDVRQHLVTTSRDGSSRWYTEICQHFRFILLLIREVLSNKSRFI